MEVVKKYLLKNARLTKVGGVLIIALLVFGVFVPLAFADAFIHNILDGAGGLVLSLFAAILALITQLAVLLAGVAGSLLQWVLNIGLFYTKCAENISTTVSTTECFIDVSWRMTRDFVNIALIIGIVVIAFFTIIGNQTYAAGKTLIPFIAVALFVNFSRVVVGVVVDISNLIMSAFIQALPNFGNISATPSTEFSFSVEGGLIILVQNAVDLLFWLGMAFILTLYAVIFMVRYGMLWMITILSPLAFAAYIFPSTKKFFTMWRDQLVQWSFIGVPMLFFLWVAVKFKEQVANFIPLGSTGSVIDEAIPRLMSLLILIIAFMLGMKTGAMGSSMIISQGKKLGAAAGMATAKFSGQMAQRGAMVGARKTAPIVGGVGRTAVKTIGGTRPIRAMGAWRAGAAKRRYEKNPHKWLRRAGLRTGRARDRNGKFINQYNRPTWDNLTDVQQELITKSQKSRLAQKAAVAYSTTRRGVGKRADQIKKQAKRFADSDWNLLTPEEQKQLVSTFNLSRFIGAKKKEVQKALEELAEAGVSDLRRTAKHPGASASRKLAAQLLLRKKDENFEGLYDEKSREQIAKNANKLDLGTDYFAHDPDMVNKLFTDPAKAAREMTKAMSRASKEIKQAIDELEHLADGQLKAIATKGTDIQKIAATTHLADRHQLEQQIPNQPEREGLIDTARKFNQEHQILKRYPHLTKDGAETKKIMDKMSAREYRFIHEGIYSDMNKFWEIYRNASAEGMLDAARNSTAHRAKLNEIGRDATTQIQREANNDVHDRMSKMAKNPRAPYTIEWTN